ncbi:MAG: hypothetical protein MSIBF_01730 [Candidatus Altiarchaeales archaeon IMC4]|nr:MAG: hypothetical protein MSIBF_01730 [Candidatus Altiarchaeales archaeon IMC4]
MKITAVGGYKAVGRNMTGVTVGNETIAIDNGIRLDTLQMYDGDTDRLRRYKTEELVNLDIIPRVDILGNVSSQLISHGHLDHVGALAITKPNAPIFGTPYTLEIGRKDYKNGDFHAVPYNQAIDVSRNMSAEFVEITHSIPQASIINVKTKEGDVVYAADFRFDNKSAIAQPDYKKLKEIGSGNVKALIVESTRVKEPGKTPSEEVVREKLDDVVEFIEEGLIIATTFSTHIERVQAILDAAQKAGRIPLLLGRSLYTQAELAERFGLLTIPPEAKTFASGKAAKNGLKMIEKREDYLLIVTGHQGEPKSVLSRMITGEIPFKFKKEDSVLFCANTIPSPINVATRYAVETKLQNLDVRIFKDLHVSGHASKEDHRRLIRMLKPEHIIPCHGDMEMRSAYAVLAAEEGYDINKSVHLLNNETSVGF